MKLWPNLPGVRVPDRMEISWAVNEEVTVALDMESDGFLGTSVYWQAQPIGPSTDAHVDFSEAMAEVKRLLDGGWRDHFEASHLAQMEGEANVGKTP